MRLIDADKLEKQWTIASPEPYSTDAAEVLESISDAQTIDAVPVVRCESCCYATWAAWANKYSCGQVHGLLVFGDHFCAFGKRERTEDE